MCFFRIFLVVSIFLSTAKLSAQLSGAYTIGGSSPDYTTINLAVGDLISQGVSGPVVFNIRDGIYTEQINIGAITGASLSNTIVFQSESNDSSSVVITFNSDSLNNYLIKLDSAGYLTFKQLTFQTSGTDFNKVLEIGNGSCNNKFSNCRIIGEYHSDVLVDSDDYGSDSNNTFINNLFINGNVGFWLWGSGDNESGIYLENNIFVNQTAETIFINNINSCKLINNKIFYSRSITNSSPYKIGIDIQNCIGKIIITGNTVLMETDSLTGFGNRQNVEGIMVNYCFGNPGQRILLSNNVINIKNYNANDSTRIRGMYVYGSYIDIYNNTILVSGLNPSLGATMAFYLVGNSDFDISNNIFANFVNGTNNAYAVGILPPVNNSEMNYNDIYSIGPYLVKVNPSTYFPSLSAWQQTGYDLNSISADPLFTDSLLHVPSYSPVCGMGTFLPEVTEDINGNLRKNPPTIGAYEIDSCEVGISEILNDSERWFTLYPNPANSVLNIFVDEEKLSGKVAIEIFNINGQKISERTSINSNQSYRFDISGLGGGIYYCTIKSGENYAIKRFVVVK